MVGTYKSFKAINSGRFSEYSVRKPSLLEISFDEKDRQGESILEKEIPYIPVEKQRESKAVMVRVREFQGDTAYCRARYKGRWLPVELNRESLESCDLTVGDLFKWYPRANGIVQEEDVFDHPRRLDPDKIREIRQTFEQLRRNWNPQIW